MIFLVDHIILENVTLDDTVLYLKYKLPKMLKE